MAEELRVVRAGYAPMKGTRHLARERVALDARGAVGDRELALVALDESDPGRGRVLRTVQNPSLVAVRAEVVGESLEVVLPGGEAVAGPVVGPVAGTGESVVCDYWGREVVLELLAGPHAEAFSRLLGRPVRLARARRGDVVFASALTVVTTGSLRDLGERAGRDLDPARFRPTLVVDSEEAYAEESWVGRELVVGEARIKIGVPVPRCAVIDIDPGSGVKDVRLLKTLATYRPLNRAGEPAFGVFAEVVEPGEVRSAPQTDLS